MNQRDRDSLSELYSVVANDIPWPNRSRTIGTEDAYRMFHFFSEGFVPQLLRCLMAVSRVDLPDEDAGAEIEHLKFLCRDGERS